MVDEPAVLDPMVDEPAVLDPSDDESTAFDASVGKPAEFDPSPSAASRAAISSAVTVSSSEGKRPGGGGMAPPTYVLPLSRSAHSTSFFSRSTVRFRARSIHAFSVSSVATRQTSKAATVPISPLSLAHLGVPNQPVVQSNEELGAGDRNTQTLGHVIAEAAETDMASQSVGPKVPQQPGQVQFQLDACPDQCLHRSIELEWILGCVIAD
jgi:hypothetical protein